MNRLTCYLHELPGVLDGIGGRYQLASHAKAAIAKVLTSAFFLLVKCFDRTI